MKPNYLSRFLSLLVVTSLVLTAQVAWQHDPIPLKHWSAPLYWQPSEPANIPASAEPRATNSPLGPNALVFVGMTPCRVVDTRTAQGFSGAFGPPMLAGGVSRTFPMQSSNRCMIPVVAAAYSLNITVVPPGPLGFITAYPTGQAPPLAATVNSPQGFIVGNAAIVTAGDKGSIDVYASNPTDMVMDINGYYASTSSVPLGSIAGIQNTALGLGALQSNTTGSYNTAIGEAALRDNTSGSENMASGQGALIENSTGSGNTAIGTQALQHNTTGSQNTAYGLGALTSNATGNNNIAIGYAAGSASSGNSNNIHLGNQGFFGDNATIRIGDPASQSSFFVAGIRGVTTGEATPSPS